MRISWKRAQKGRTHWPGLVRGGEGTWLPRKRGVMMSVGGVKLTDEIYRENKSTVFIRKSSRPKTEREMYRERRRSFSIGAGKLSGPYKKNRGKLIAFNRGKNA